MTSFKEPKRFWSKVDVGEADECWEWLACKRRGYDVFRIHYKLWKAHRVAWILTYGPIPKGLCVLHKCDNPGCCNPYHLFLGSQKENIQDASRKGRLRKALTKEEVLEIWELPATGMWKPWKRQELADKFDVTRATISAILRRKNWKSI